MQIRSEFLVSFYVSRFTERQAERHYPVLPREASAPKIALNSQTVGHNRVRLGLFHALTAAPISVIRRCVRYWQ